MRGVKRWGCHEVNPTSCMSWSISSLVSSCGTSQLAHSDLGLCSQYLEGTAGADVTTL